jgi:hypothetical protein
MGWIKMKLAQRILKLDKSEQGPAKYRAKANDLAADINQAQGFEELEQAIGDFARDEFSDDAAIEFMNELFSRAQDSLTNPMDLATSIETASNDSGGGNYEAFGDDEIHGGEEDDQGASAEAEETQFNSLKEILRSLMNVRDKQVGEYRDVCKLHSVSAALSPKVQRQVDLIKIVLQDIEAVINHGE